MKLMLWLVAAGLALGCKSRSEPTPAPSPVATSPALDAVPPPPPGTLDAAPPSPPSPPSPPPISLAWRACGRVADLATMGLSVDKREVARENAAEVREMLKDPVQHLLAGELDPDGRHARLLLPLVEGIKKQLAREPARRGPMLDALAGAPSDARLAVLAELDHDRAVAAMAAYKGVQSPFDKQAVGLPTARRSSRTCTSSASPPQTPIRSASRPSIMCSIGSSVGP